MLPPIPPLTGVILAGGQGQRLGGVDKGLIKLANRPLIAHVLDRLRPQVASLVISANRNHQDYGAWGVPVVPDQHPHFMGPLAGLLAAVTIAPHEWILAVPVDCPLVMNNLAQRLWTAIQQEGGRLAVAHDGTQIQPLCLLMHRELATTLADYLANNGRAVTPWCYAQGAIVVDLADEPEAFLNINTPGELALLEQRLAGIENRLVNAHRPVLGFAAWSGTGKTTLLTQLLPRLLARGIQVGVIKHAHHQFDIDYPGKDSYELRKAGASQMLVASRQRWALVTEQREAQADPDLDTLISRLDQQSLHLILVEGFRHLSFPKIELHRPLLGRPLLFPHDPSIIAVASDQPISLPDPLPWLNLNSSEDIATFILNWLGR